MSEYLNDAGKLLVILYEKSEAGQTDITHRNAYSVLKLRDRIDMFSVGMIEQLEDAGAIEIDEEKWEDGEPKEYQHYKLTERGKRMGKKLLHI